MKNFLLKLKMIFSSVTTWFAKVLKENDNIVKVVAPFAINVCNFIKEYNGNDIVKDIEAWASVSGGVVGKVSVGLINSFLTDEMMDKIIIALNIMDNAAGITNVSDKLVMILNYVKTLETDKKALAWTTISAQIASYLSDGKLSWQELFSIVRGIYDTEKN